MNQLEKSISMIECQHAIHSFYMSLDGSDFQAVSSLFASNGIWHRQGKQLVGPAAVLEALLDRPAGRVTAHMVQNVVITVIDTQSASATYLNMVYRCDRKEPSSEPAPMHPLSILKYVDSFTKDPKGNWLLLSKTSKPIFIS
jgi:hypothetical protein